MPHSKWHVNITVQMVLPQLSVSAFLYWLICSTISVARYIGEIEMPNSNNTLCLDKFYPEKDLKITDIVQQKDKILIRMKSISKSCLLYTSDAADD